MMEHRMVVASLVPNKRCRKCQQDFPANTDWFNKKLDGLTAWCRSCRSADRKATYAANAEQINAAVRAKRSDETRAQDRKRYAENPEKKRASVLAWRNANPEKCRLIDQRQYEKFQDRKKKQAAEWSQKNKKRVQENMRAWFSQKQATDPRYRLANSISSYVYWCLKNKKNGKKTADILGYTIEELQTHLERQFQPGMSWNNYGQWHVDHIVPVAAFSFSSHEDENFKACWAITNLRPLWAAENLRKRNRRELLL
jgi:hypothetical protein